MIRTNKQLIVCLTVCLIVSFVAGVYAAPPLEPRGSAPVTVVNPVSKPIPVTGVNKYPVQKEVQGEFMMLGNWALNIETVELYTVPLDKRLVIEYFSCRNGNAGSYNTSYSCYIHTSLGFNQYVSHFLPTTPYGHSAIQDIEQKITNDSAHLSAGEKVQIYAEPGTEVVAGAWRQNNAINHKFDYPEYIIFSFSGYLVDAPLPVDTGPQ